MEQTNYKVYAGFDWAVDAHVVWAIDADGRDLFKGPVRHEAVALRQAVDRLVDEAGGDPTAVAIAIETPRGALVETLLDRECAVYAINPKQADRFRDRFFPSGAKDDSKDAMVLAHSLLTDRERAYRRIRPDAAAVVELREHVRMLDDLASYINGDANRLRQVLRRADHPLLRVTNDVTQPWVLTMLERAPGADSARKLKKAAIGAVLKKHRIRKVTPSDVYAAFQASGLPIAESTVRACEHHARALVPRLRLAMAQKKATQRSVETLLSTMIEAPPPEGREHHDAEILLSLPGVGRYVAAVVLAEASMALADRDYSAFRAHAGIAPVTQQTGKQRHGPKSRRKPKVLMRKACSSHLRNAAYHCARVASQKDELARAHYRRCRERGHSHGRALRSVADRIFRIAFAMLTNDSLYEPARLQRRAPDLEAA